MNFLKDKFGRQRKSSDVGGGRAAAPAADNGGANGCYGVTGGEQWPGGGRASAGQASINGSCHRPLPGSASTSFLSSGALSLFSGKKTLPRSVTADTLSSVNSSTLNGRTSLVNFYGQQPGEGEEPRTAGQAWPRQRASYRSTSLPRSSANRHKRSVTVPNFQDDSIARADGVRHHHHQQQQQQPADLVTPVRYRNSAGGGGRRARPKSAVELDVQVQLEPTDPATKSELLRISRARLRDTGRADGKRNKNASRDNSLESLLEEEDQQQADVTDAPLRQEAGRGNGDKAGGGTKTSLECLLDAQTDYNVPLAVKNKSNSLPKSAFSNIQLKVQEIRDQLEVLKQSSHSSGSKALQQVFPRLRPPLLADDFPDEGFLEPKKDRRHLNTPVTPAGASSSSSTLAYGLHDEVRLRGEQATTTFRPGFINNRPMSMPSPPLQNSPGNSPSISPRSLSPNPQGSPKCNVRPSYYPPPAPTAPRGSAMPRPFAEFSATSPQSSPSTLSPCSSNSLPSSQGVSKGIKATLTSLQLQTLGKTLFDEDDELDEKQVEKLVLFFEVMSTQEKISKVRPAGVRDPL